MAKAPNHLDLQSGLSQFLPPKRGIGYSPHTPHPKQQEFLDLDVHEALFGGQAGGGKSDTLIMAALQHVHVNGYAALLLRRTYKDLSLPGAIMDRAKTWLASSSAKWNDESKTFTFDGGGRLTFGYLQQDKDRFRYQSSEFQCIGFDELTQFPEQWYRYLASRLRKPEHGPLSKVPLRLLSGSNPGGIGNEWVRRRWAPWLDPESTEKATPGAPLWYVERNGLSVRCEPGTPGAASRTFLPSRLTDNPSLDAASYGTSLSMLDHASQRQLRDGIWTRDAGGLVYHYVDDVNKARTMPPLTRFVLGVDFGYTDACGFSELGWTDRRVYVTRTHRAESMSPSEAAEFVRGWMSQREYEKIVADEGGLGKGYVAEGRKRFSIPYEAAQKTNKAGYIKLFNSSMERGEIQVFPGNDVLLSEWAEIPWNEDRSGYAEGFADHLSDATLYGWRETSGWAARLPSEAAHETQAAALAREEAELEVEIMRIQRTHRGGHRWMRDLIRKMTDQ